MITLHALTMKIFVEEYECKHVKSDTTFINSMLYCPTLLFDKRLK
ncbi:hypothetical protein NMY3_02798 [Candidatus Nitrosocosmicus oleophilus]|jgi:hypothetical protein|uniref:Uncharacterized protein n=1 Tax=Candidatus Nitrosocosmicus oleophilus TaxID=1353260 RepID=A0A654LZU9_9ARCH|nr:hypothetical protein NMY3_02798 [Candidatus Nitrosocosmicus oleophilus]